MRKSHILWDHGVFKLQTFSLATGCARRIGLVMLVASSLRLVAAPPEKPPTVQAAGSAHWSDLQPEVGQADAFGESPELVKLGPGQPGVAPEGDGQAKYIPVHYFRRSPQARGPLAERDPVIQSDSPTPNTPGPSASFEGINNIDGYTPPDTVGAIGPSNYVQAVNVRVQVFNRFTGAAQTSANAVSSLFSSLGTGSLCASTDDGDPVVLYDQYADRWLVTQFANASSTTGPYYMSIAISKTGDPTGAYYAYCFQMPNVSGGKFPDYPKISVWPDGYYMAVNQFNGAGTSFIGAGVYAFERAKMLVGDPSAKFIYFNVNSIDPNVYSLLPASVDGPLPPLGTPDYFVYLRGTTLGDSSDDLRLFQFHADFANTNLSTFTERAESPVAVAAYSAFSPNTAGIPQPGTSVKLDTLADRLMFRLQYRNFGSNESLVVTHTATGGSGQAGIRYYQLRRTLPGGAFAINEQATYAPDANHRWMGSAAMNYHGDLAVGYSVSSSSVYPSIRYAARLADDPAGGLYQGEATMITGGGSQTSTNSRWGDYSCMTIDPTDDCTFWYTQEYYATTSTAGWRTRFGSFSLPGCGPAPRATIQGTVTRAGSGAPLSNVVVRTASGYFRVTGANGAYLFNLVPGTNDLTAQLAGTGTNTIVALGVTNGEVRVQDFVLGAAAPDIRTNSYSLTAETCANNAIDPGETVTLNLGLKNLGTVNTTNLVVTLLSANGVTSPSGAQNYGVLSTNGTPVSRSFSFTASGSCGGSIAPAFQLQDGAANLGTNTLIFPLGFTTAALSENFDGVTAPALPAGWATALSGAQSNWVTSVTQFDAPPNSAFSRDPSLVGVNELDSPVVTVPSSGVQLSFRHYYNTEASSSSTNVGYDGGVLEIKIGNGSYADIIAAGGSFVSGGYNRTISSSFNNPLAGRTAWSGNSGGFITTVVNLPAGALGQNCQFRWRLGSDDSTSGTGWYVDSVSLVGALCCTGPTAPSILTQPQSQAVNVGDNATFTVAASGTSPLSYQWRTNDVAIPGATTNTYTRLSVTTNDALGYSVVITNSIGSVTSAVASLTVNIPVPVISAQPQSQVVFVGSPVNFFVTASGGQPLSYQWQSNGVPIAGATQTNYSLAGAQLSYAATYRVVITNSFGVLTSSNASLTVISGYSGVLAGWDMNAVTNFGVSPMAPTMNAANISVVGLTRGSGVTTSGSAATRAWGGNGFNATSAAAAVTAGDYVTLGISANSGYQLSFNSVSAFNYRRSGSGATNGVLQFQIDGGAFTDIATLNYSSSSSSGASLAPIDLSAITALQSVGAGTNVTFRIVNYNATTSTGTWYIYDVGNTNLLDFAISGGIASLYPPPAAAPLLTSLLLNGNQFQFTLTGTPGSNYIVQVSTNLTGSNWISLRTNTAPFSFIESNASSFPQRFYRGLVAP